MKIRAAWLTNTGKKRPHNEDALLAGSTLVAGESAVEPAEGLFAETPTLLAVADGVGGARKGEVASRSTLETLLSLPGPLRSEADVARAIVAARRRLNDHVRDNPGSRGLGTALAGLALDGDRAIAFNCGDCRVYRANGGFLDRLTRDHSLVMKLVECGEIEEEAMRHHPRKNVITSAVMGDLGEEPPEFFSREIAVSPGDRFLLCSDGVWECFDRAELEARFTGEPAEIVRKVRDGVLAGEARDNFTLIVAEALA